MGRWGWSIKMLYLLSLNIYVSMQLKKGQRQTFRFQVNDSNIRKGAFSTDLPRCP